MHYCSVGLKSDGTTGQTTGHLEVDTPWATVPSLSTCDRHTTGHWPVAFFKGRDRRDTFNGNWITRGYANSRIANSRTGHLADWTTRGLADAVKRTKTKHTKSPVASASCPVRDLSSPRVD